MPALSAPASMKGQLETLRTEFADLAYQLERQGRCDAADVVMQIDRRVREMVDTIEAEESEAAETRQEQLS